jgi:hypothetical protein
VSGPLAVEPGHGPSQKATRGRLLLVGKKLHFMQRGGISNRAELWRCCLMEQSTFSRPMGRLRPCCGMAVWIVRSALGCAEQRLYVGVVVANQRSGERPPYAQLLEPGCKGGLCHGVAIVRVEDQRLARAFADLLPQALQAEAISGDFRLPAFGHVPGLRLAVGR